MKRIQRATLDEIASRAGVSRGTVSRVLNGKNKENRPAIARRSSKIREIAIELGYRPNVAARSIFSGKFHAVAFVTCGDLGRDWFPISGLHGIHTTLEELEWRLMFTELPARKINNPNVVPQLFREASVDGLIVNLIPFFSEEIVDYFEAQPLPCVWLNLKRPLRSVYPDEIAGAAMAVKWLTERGHRRIGFFSRSFLGHVHYSVIDRFSGFVRAMKSAGLSSHRHFNPIAAEPAKDEPLLLRATQFVSRFPDLDAVVCYELEDAVCLSMSAKQNGLELGTNNGILGYAEREIRSVTGLPIQTLIIPFKEVGRKAVQMLSHILSDKARNVPSISVPFSSIRI